MLSAISIFVSISLSMFIIHGTPNGFIIVEGRTPTVVLENGHYYITNCDVLQVKPDDAFKLLVANWTKSVTMNEFCILARHWDSNSVQIIEPNVVEPNIPDPNIPEPIIEPNSVEPDIIWYSESDVMYHMGWCPAKMFNAYEAPLPIVTIDNKIPCTICNPPLYLGE